MRMYNTYVCLFVCLFVVMVQDVVVSVGLVTFYIAFGSTAANRAGSWDDWVDFVDAFFSEQTQQLLDLDLIEDIRNAVTATAVSGAFIICHESVLVSTLCVCVCVCVCAFLGLCYIKNSTRPNVLFSPSLLPPLHRHSPYRFSVSCLFLCCSYLVFGWSFPVLPSRMRRSRQLNNRRQMYMFSPTPRYPHIVNCYTHTHVLHNQPM